MLRAYRGKNEEYGIIIKRGIPLLSDYSILFIKADEYNKFRDQLNKTLSNKHLFKVMEDLKEEGFIIVLYID